ncbi:MAG: FAD-binding protein, partial [Calditrichaeota bacterium]|nr:FAD-binding protein [Calditrichota bacterium]
VADLSDVARDIVVRGDELVAGGGAWLGDVVRLAAEEGLGGMEKLAGIPGGVGGGLSMNAGAFGMAISDHLVEVETATPDGRLVKMSKSDVGFAYRSAPGLMNKAVVTARFVLPRRRSKDVLKVVEETIAERFRRNTMMLPSAGSVFKNPPGGFAARLIESAGGKGQTAGGAEVSPLHANFIVNARGGTTSDIVTLIRRIRTMVYQTQGVELKLELRTLGFAAPPDEGFDD